MRLGVCLDEIDLAAEGLMAGEEVVGGGREQGQGG